MRDDRGVSVTYAAKLAMSNSTNRPRIVWVEPWGEDYTLMPGEELLITAEDTAEQPWFHVVELADSSQVYIEAGGAFQVLQGSRRLECGHNRHAAQEAGLWT
jgi:hypothetical protein